MYNINYRHYLATLPSKLNVEWIRENISDDIKNIILDNCENDTFDRFSFLDKFENGQPSLVLVIPSRNNEEYVKKNLQSIAIQDYKNYRIIYLDDQSSDNTVELVKKTANQLGLTNRLKLVVMPQRNRQGASRFRAYHMCDDDEILCMLDGDDWLYNKQSLNMVAIRYKNGSK